MSKKFLKPLILILIGIFMGGGIVFSYYNSSNDGLLKNNKIAGLFQGGSQEISDEAAAAAYIKFRNIRKSFVPSGVPEVYGEELNISFDNVQDAIDKVQVYGPTYGLEGKKITLSGADLDRYIDIGSRIACEYCCGVKTLVREDGVAACGCAHSIMMRGLSAYLITVHPELSNDQILGELAAWKRTFFPKQTLSAELQTLEASGDTGIKEMLKEFPDFLPQMVGGC